MGAGNSKLKITAQDKAILDLKLQRDKLKRYQKQIQALLDREQQVARNCLAANQRNKALTALRRRKYQESILTRTYSQLGNLEELVSTIEFSLIEQSVLHGLKQGNAVLNEIHREMTIDNVEKLLADTQEAQEYQREIDEMLSTRITAEDEDAVQEELQQLLAEASQSAESGRPLYLPSVPNNQVEVIQTLQRTKPDEDRTKVALEA